MLGHRAATAASNKLALLAKLTALHQSGNPQLLLLVAFWAPRGLQGTPGPRQRLGGLQPLPLQTSPCGRCPGWQEQACALLLASWGLLGPFFAALLQVLSCWSLPDPVCLLPAGQVH